MTFGLFPWLLRRLRPAHHNQFGRESIFCSSWSWVPPSRLPRPSSARLSACPGASSVTDGRLTWTFISGVGIPPPAGIAWVLYNFTRLDRLLHLHGAHAHSYLFSGCVTLVLLQMPMIMPARQAGGAIGFTHRILGSLCRCRLPRSAPVVRPSGCAIFCALCSVLCWVIRAQNALLPG